MNWLNINISTLRSPAYLGSTPVQQATWIKLLAWCAHQENGGRIAAAASWDNRAWLQICGVTAREVRAASQLILIDGADVCVAFYPVEKELEVRTRRAAATEAANRRWHGKLRRDGGDKDGGQGLEQERGEDQQGELTMTAKPPAYSKEPRHAPVSSDALVDASADASRIAAGIAPVYAEEKENEKGREMEGKGTYASLASDAPPVREALSVAPGESRGRLCNLRSAILHGMRLEPPCPEQWAAKWWEDCEKRGWVDNHGIALCQWQPALSSYWRGVQEQDRRSDAAQEKTAATRSASAGEINARIKGIDDELFRLRQRAPDGRSPDGLRTIKIYTSEQETRREELLAGKEALKRKLTEVGV